MVTKNILLIGATRSGKSTLANVLTETNDFTEGHLGVSQTKEVKVSEFKSQSGETYQLVDVMGFGDTNASQEESLYSLAEISYAVKDGLNQVLLTMSGSSLMRIASSEKASYDWLKNIVFDEEFVDHVTIVRTKFENFEDGEACKKDIEKLLKERKSSNYGGVVIHVDNPRIDAISKRGKENKEFNKESRRLSRQVVLKRLEECESNFYCPENLEVLNESIGEEMKEILEDGSIAENETEYKYRKKTVVKKFIDYIRSRRGMKLSIGYDFWEELDKTERRLEREIETLGKDREAMFKQLRAEKQKDKTKAIDNKKETESKQEKIENFQQGSLLEEWLQDKFKEIKSHKHDWIIEEVVTFSGKVYDDKSRGWLKIGEEKKEILLINYKVLAKLTYCRDNGFLVFTEGMFLKQHFGEEIEKVLNDWSVRGDREEIYRNYDSTWKKLCRKVEWKNWETEEGLKVWMTQLRRKLDSIERWQKQEEKETIMKKFRSEGDHWTIVDSNVLSFESKEELVVHLSVLHNKEVSTIECDKVYKRSFFSDEEWGKIKFFLLHQSQILQGKK